MMNAFALSKPALRIIALRSRVRVSSNADHTRPEWKGERGRPFRIGYYDHKDRFDTMKSTELPNPNGQSS